MLRQGNGTEGLCCQMRIKRTKMLFDKLNLITKIMARLVNSRKIGKQQVMRTGIWTGFAPPPIPVNGPIIIG